MSKAGFHRMKVSPAETESVLRLLAATPRRIASLSQGIEISNLHFRRRQDSWSANDILAHLRACPVLAMQGEDDEYGTMEQIERIADKAPRVELLKLIDCGHSPHRDQPEVVIQAAARFVNRRLSI